MDFFARVKSTTKNGLLLSLLVGLLSPVHAQNNKTANIKLIEAKGLAKYATVSPIPGTHSYEAYYGDYMIIFDLIPGDATTLGFAGGVFSFNHYVSDEENLLLFSDFLEAQFKKELGRKSKKSISTSYVDRVFDFIFPKAHANGLVVALVVAVIAVAIYAVVKKDKERKDSQAKKDKKLKKDYNSLISEQFVKGDKYRAQNAEALADNTKLYAGRPNPDAHDCYIMSRAWHDHMKYPEKNYAPIRSNYQCI
ncbi:MAG: hypothetical protein R3A80_07535 [Bdellovibrionota bacterium]